MRFLLTGDWHLRGEAPTCRTDDWLTHQRDTVAYIVAWANAHQLPICNTGDIFHTPRTATGVVNMALEEIAKAKYGFKLLAGNHDLLLHSYEFVNQCSIGTLFHSFGELTTSESDGCCAFPFGLDAQSDLPVRFIHRLIFENDEARPMEGCGSIAEEVLEEFPEQKWIFSGDMHHAFHFKKKGRHLVNPGCTTIQVSDMADYKPRFAVVDTDKETVEWIFIPQPEHSVVDISYNVEKKERDVRMSAFVEKIESTQKGVTLSFWNNLETTMATCSKGIQKILLQVKEKTKNEAK